MLSKGIPSRMPASPTAQRHTIPMIELAHAPLGLRDLGTREQINVKSPENTSTFVPVSKTPETREAKGSSSSGHGRSRVLDVLDTKEPMFLRATLNRILNLPDLAGLSGTGCASKRPWMEEDGDWYARDEHKKKKTVSPLNDDPQLFHPQVTSFSPSVSSPNDSDTWLRDNRGHALTGSIGYGVHAPREDDELPDYLQLLRPVSPISHSNHSRAAGVSSLPPSSEQASSLDLTGTVPTVADMDEDQDLDDSGFDLDFERQHCTFLPQDEYEQSPTRSVTGVPFQDDDDDEIAVFDGSPRRYPQFAENNLYEHQDPWHTIGVILGLSPVRPEDRLDEASEEQDIPFVRITQSLSESEDQHGLGLDEDVPSDVRDSDKSATQQNFPPFWVAEDEFKDDLDEYPLALSDVQGSRCTLHQDFPPAPQQNTEDQTQDTQIPTMDIDFVAPSYANFPPGSVWTPSPIEEPQSPFRILLESKRTSSKYSRGSNSSEISGSLAPSQSSSSRSRSSLAPRTPSPRGTEEAQSPFRMLLAARNRDRSQKKADSNLTDYSLDSDAVSSPGFDFGSSTILKEVGGVIQGPCLFPDDAYDASDED
ncbi:hypothetical protein C0995_011200 [Termitomyces sp. Mi166|nr:hypothetical protein C0995_011200 [Termitomyces sp. Mi166\